MAPTMPDARLANTVRRDIERLLSDDALTDAQLSRAIRERLRLARTCKEALPRPLWRRLKLILVHPNISPTRRRALVVLFINDQRFTTSVSELARIARVSIEDIAMEIERLLMVLRADAAGQAGAAS